jgi:hypothetical protein
LALAAWVRAVLLEKDTVGGELATLLGQLIPEIEPSLTGYRAAEGAAERRFAAIWLILKHPGARPYVDQGLGRTTPLARIDDFRDNWWCSLALDTELSAPNYHKRYAAHTGGPEAREQIAEQRTPSFVSKPEREAARQERRQLFSIGSAPNHMAQMVLEWAKQNPDPRVPEALHLAVKSTRYGCADKETGGYSKAAFQLLHQRYPESPWAKKTPYWYSE